ncbi:MAG: deoxynucleoside kinase [Moritella sp.]|uniref:deoxynucleoside kinase n=2 Tax=Moritella sp. TaxID=78556 RepID=UPI0025E2648B|nr:deoxynucleoside kinase [Moritella sp.]NQZ91650.1 deoxynucleoside kinase [Moritella sp.]
MSNEQTFKLVAIEGNIGVGKSTLLPLLAKELTEHDNADWQLILEDVDSDPEFQRLLQAFTVDPARRIEFQRYITNKRSDICKDLDPAFNYIIERSLFSDLVFCQANLAEACRPDGKDLDYYYDIQTKLVDYPRVSAVVYLRCEAETAYTRMLSRARDAEQGTPREYLQLISDCHDTFLPHICRKYDTVLLTEDWTEFGCPTTLAKRIISEGI